MRAPCAGMGAICRHAARGARARTSCAGMNPRDCGHSGFFALTRRDPFDDHRGRRGSRGARRQGWASSPIGGRGSSPGRETREGARRLPGPAVRVAGQVSCFGCMGRTCLEDTDEAGRRWRRRRREGGRAGSRRDPAPSFDPGGSTTSASTSDPGGAGPPPPSRGGDPRCPIPIPRLCCCDGELGPSECGKLDRDLHFAGSVRCYLLEVLVTSVVGARASPNTVASWAFI